MAPRPFLGGQWKTLVMLSYEADPARLQPFVPRGTELDTWQGKAFISLVGFEFLDARWLGLRIPFHQDFAEVNLRCYVRRKGPEGWRRGVVFVKEVAPKLAVALTARWRYNQNFHALPMRREIRRAAPGEPPEAAYFWRRNGRWECLRAAAAGPAALPEPDSLDEYIVEHYRAYVTQRDGGTMEYEVGHPRWRIWPAIKSGFECDAAAFYGEAFADALHRPPASAFIADGSTVAVHPGQRL